MRSRLWLTAAAGVAGLAVVCVPSVGSAGAATSLPSNTAGNCGGTVMPKPGGGTWQCSFDDEFTGTTLNSANWVVQQTATSGFTTGQAPGLV